MILVDTSVWIDFFGPRPGVAGRRLDNVIQTGEAYALTGVILQEVLQGARSDRELERLESYLLTERFLHPQDPLVSYAQAARLYQRCRQAGVTPRSAADCLIAQIAIEHQARLLHHDADFDHISRVVPELVICAP